MHKTMKWWIDHVSVRDTGTLVFVCLSLCCLRLAAASKPSQAGAIIAPSPIRTDVPYGPFPHQLLDVYLPSQAQGSGPFPVVVWYGGIWKASKGVPGDLHTLLAGHCALVSVEVRSMEDATNDKVTVPISYVLLDARRAVQFVRLHAKEYNLDPDRIATAGSSQGSLPALYVACAGEKADPHSADAVERTSTCVTCVGAFRSQPSIDPKVMQEWVPGVQWGAPALGYSFDESLQRRQQLLPFINEWSPDALLSQNRRSEKAPPIYFYNNWSLTKPPDWSETEYLVHSPRWALGFQKVAEAHGVTCYVDFPGHPPAKYKDMWDFLVQELNGASSRSDKFYNSTVK